MKGGKSQPDMAEVPIAALKSLAAGSAEASLARDSLEKIQVSANSSLLVACRRYSHQSGIQSPVGNWLPHLVNIVENAVRDLQDCLVDNILV